MKFLRSLLEKKQFDSVDVISKLKDAEKMEYTGGDTVGFAIEDGKGNIVKIKVRADQAEKFEKELGIALNQNISGANEFTDDISNSEEEIAEILYNLNQKYDIVDAEWPTISGDEEEEPEDGELEGDVDDDSMDDEHAEDDSMDGLDADDPESEMVPDEETTDIKSVLNQIIGMLQSQAEAEKAKAEAEAEKAKAKQAEITDSMIQYKMKKEEEILDMEAYYAKKKEAEKEATQIQKMAKYKHDVSNESLDTIKYLLGKKK